jgi:uncharacterized protein YjbI with pentapeptide repeats
MKMYKLSQDEFDKLSDQHQFYVESLGKTGRKIQINKFDLRKLKIKNLSLTDSFITESIFCGNIFENVEVFDANLCGCEFDNMTFLNVNIVKTNLSYCLFKNCKFINTKIKCCETNESSFENTQFVSCDLYDIFSYSSLKNILFSQMSLKHLDFYGVMVNNIVLKDIKGFDINEAVISINTGNFKNEIMIKGIDAVNYFTKMCTYE